MNNSDMPAMPCTFQTPEDDLLTGGGANVPEWTTSGGLTKREHFAGLAPDKIPEWFSRTFQPTSSIPEPEHTDEQKKLANEYYNENYGLSEEDFKEATRIAHEIRAYNNKVSIEYEGAIYFAWRTHYADMILKELDK